MTSPNAQPQVCLLTSMEQAAVITIALDFYSRICSGQLNEITEFVRMGLLPQWNTKPDQSHAPVSHATQLQIDQVDTLARKIKQALGFPPSCSYSIGSHHLPTSVHRAWEVKKVIEKAMAEHENPNPVFKSVRYDGLLIRYTKDPAPVCTIQTKR